MSLKLGKYLVELKRNASRFERIDINGVAEKSFLGKHLRKIVCSIVSVILVYNLDNGFSQNFVSYASSVLSILIGLFITAIIFSFDKFHNNLVKDLNDYDINIKRDDVNKLEKSFQVSIKEIIEPNAKQKLWDTQSHNYSKQFAYVTGYNIVLCVFAIALLAFSALFENIMSIDIFKYRFDLAVINKESLFNFIIVVLVALQRFLVLYWIVSVMYNTLFVVSSMVNFMTIKIDRSND